MEKKFRKNVGIILMNKDGLVLAARPAQSSQDGTWQMPQGGIDEGETPLQAARRELWEETGVKDTIFLKESPQKYSYLFPDWVQEIRKVRYPDDDYVGQEQQWFLFLYNGKNVWDDIEKRTSQELIDFKWVDIQTLPDKVIPFKKEVYTAVVRDFSDIIQKSRS